MPRANFVGPFVLYHIFNHLQAKLAISNSWLPDMKVERRDGDSGRG